MIDFTFLGMALVFGVGFSLLITVPIFLSCVVFRILKLGI